MIRLKGVAIAPVRHEVFQIAGFARHAGENIKYVQNQLGHSSPTVTLNVYSHLMKKENQEAACRLENTIFSGCVS